MTSYLRSFSLPRSLCPPQEIKEMKINPSRNESSPGLAIAPLVWSQPHNIPLNSSPHPKPMPKDKKNRGRQHTSNPNFKQKKINHGQTRVPRWVVHVPPFNREVEVDITGGHVPRPSTLGGAFKQRQHLICCEEEE
jgi:hypothetical protein